MDNLDSIIELDRIIHEPMRLVIVTILKLTARVDYLYLLRETNMTKGNLSFHLRKLEEADYINVEKTYRKKVPQTFYSLTPTGAKALQQYRRQLQNLLSMTE